MLFRHLSRGVTMHTFEQPPTRVLDLGCGTGLWAIEAAKFWPNCTIVGFDLLPIQPDLTQTKLGIEFKELSERIEWVHGDFFNDLPFESDHFEFVRISLIGLSVPEDMWQEILEECARVLRPGGCIEVLEEDLIFPAGRTRKPDVPGTSKAQEPHPPADRNRSDSMASRLTTQTSQTGRTSHTTGTDSSYLYTTEHSSQSNSIDSYLSSSSQSGTDSEDEYVEDHKKLKDAWEEMLSRRFLTHKLLNVLPFYLSSAFTNVHLHPAIHIRGPRTTIASMLHPDGQDPEFSNWVEDMRSHVIRFSTSDGPQKISPATLRSTKSSGTRVSLWSALHLARQVRLVSACKEAIWEAYCALTGAAREAFLRPDAAAKELPKEELREEFEREWAAWESDMKDRIGMHEHVPEALGWENPETLGMRGSSQASSSLRGSSERTKPPPRPPAQNLDWDTSPKASLCRSMRGFLAWKPIPSR
ncbi:hypothetical protein BD414DRAFT_493967 [Trametes punicea]|nr:hypothetical protein BD414DRAFT_493967 [Trametes punicea]